VAQFDKSTPSLCQQCGGAARFEYHTNKENMYGFFETVPGAVDDQPHMHRTCGLCGYEWAEEPIV